MPLGNISARNNYKVAKASLQQIELQFKQLEQNIMVQIDNAVKQAQSAYQSVQATRQARIYAEAALDAEQKTYGVGKATTFEVLQYQNNLTTARSAEIRALANYNESLPLSPSRKAARSNATTSTSRRSNIRVIILLVSILIADENRTTTTEV